MNDDNDIGGSEVVDAAFGLVGVMAIIYVIVAVYVTIKLIFCRLTGRRCIVGSKEI